MKLRMGHMAGAVLLLLLALPSAWADPVWQGVDRIVAIGDVHGDYDQYIEALTRSGVIDDRLRWSGGETHLVQLGDVPDRGPDTLKIIRHLQKLERQARRAGGRVHALIGNHEAMNITGDLRYVHPGEYAAFVTRASERRRDAYVERVAAWMAENAPDADRSLEVLNARFPVGYVEHRQAWAPDGDIGEWVISHNAVIKINDTLFVHGGLSPHREPLSLEEINRRIRDVLEQGELATGEHFANAAYSPLWYRGLATAAAETEQAPLVALLDDYGAQRIVIAHTPTGGNIQARLGGRVIMADVGLGAHYGANDASLVIEDGVFFALTPTGRTKLGID